MGDILLEIRTTIRGNLIRQVGIVIDRIGIVEVAAAAEAVVDVITAAKWDTFLGSVRIAEAVAVAAVAEAVAVGDREVRAEAVVVAAAVEVVVDVITAAKRDTFREIVRMAEAEEVAAVVVDAIVAEVAVDATVVAEEAAAVETRVIIADNRDIFRENVRKVLVEIIAEDFRYIPGMVVERLKDRLWFLLGFSIGNYSRVEGKYVSCSTCFDRKNWTRSPTECFVVLR